MCALIRVTEVGSRRPFLSVAPSAHDHVINESQLKLLAEIPQEPSGIVVLM
jgi:hypothetical protein